MCLSENPSSGVLFLHILASPFPWASLYYSFQFQFSICKTEVVIVILAHFVWEGTLRINEIISQWTPQAIFIAQISLLASMGKKSRGGRAEPLIEWEELDNGLRWDTYLQKHDKRTKNSPFTSPYSKPHLLCLTPCCLADLPPEENRASIQLPWLLFQKV